MAWRALCGFNNHTLYIERCETELSSVFAHAVQRGNTMAVRHRQAQCSLRNWSPHIAFSFKYILERVYIWPTVGRFSYAKSLSGHIACHAAAANTQQTFHIDKPSSRRPWNYHCCSMTGCCVATIWFAFIVFWHRNWTIYILHLLPGNIIAATL